MLVSGATYITANINHLQLSSQQLLLLYFMRCHLTVSVTLGLVLGPKLWLIAKNKPILLIKTLGANSVAATHASNKNNPQTKYLVHSDKTSNVPGIKNGRNSIVGAASALAGANAAAVGGGQHVTGLMPPLPVNARHRCHISCDVHDTHLQDASRLQQAMLSSSALDFGVIHLADMDPDEIKAELKRVYAQCEMLQTKLMRRDNPHISKRRGGKKPTHSRKFSLQAFHPKLLSAHGTSEKHSNAHSSSSVGAEDASTDLASSTTMERTPTRRPSSLFQVLHGISGNHNNTQDLSQASEATKTKPANSNKPRKVVTLSTTVTTSDGLAFGKSTTMPCQGYFQPQVLAEKPTLKAKHTKFKLKSCSISRKTPKAKSKKANSIELDESTTTTMNCEHEHSDISLSNDYIDDDEEV